MGASDLNQPNLSRAQGDPQYTKWNTSIARLQGITQKVSLYVSGTGQYAYDPLLSAEQFTFGGTGYGQAYDPAELTGDKGLAGKAELRYSAAPQWRFLNSLQYFGFYDIGKVWNKLPASVTGLPQQESGASAGLGVRISFNEYMYGSAEMAKPLTRDVATMQNRAPRYFVSLTFSGKTKLLDSTPAPASPTFEGAATNGPVARAQSALPPGN
jgi:hemolysin activation/secretion protein